MPQNLTEQLSREQQIAALEKDWANNPRWKGVKRGYSAADVVRLRGSLHIEHTLAKRGADKLWRLINGDAKKGYVNSFGAISAGQAMQQAKAGLEAVYLSGWQVAADGNTLVASVENGHAILTKYSAADGASAATCVGDPAAIQTRGCASSVPSISTSCCRKLAMDL